MTRVWPHRPELLHLAMFFIVYLLGGGFAQALAIVPGTGISIWPPSGLFLATLAFAARRSWPWWVMAGFLAELSGNLLWFHNPLPVAVLIFTGNALEAMTGAWLVTRFGPAGPAGILAGSARADRAGCGNCPRRQCDSRECNACGVRHAALRDGMAAVLARKRNRGPDRGAACAGPLTGLA
jgi:hypothetical protein